MFLVSCVSCSDLLRMCKSFCIRHLLPPKVKCGQKEKRFNSRKVGWLLLKTASYEAGVYRITATGKIVKGWRQRGYQPMPYGDLAVLRSHSCVAPSAVLRAGFIPRQSDGIISNYAGGLKR